LPYAALARAAFQVRSDVAARLMLCLTDLPAGVMTALIDGPFLVYLVRWRMKAMTKPRTESSEPSTTRPP
jgi:iron complex transport system permease protein